MAKPVEFGKFYKLLEAVRDGDKERDKELQWMLAEYEHAQDSKGPYDELGQIFCHHGVMELFDYTGVDSINLISNLDKSVWEYLELRTGIKVNDYMIKSMLDHANKHTLDKKVSEKWGTSIEEVNSNMEDLAKYVVDGIIEIIH